MRWNVVLACLVLVFVSCFALFACTTPVDAGAIATASSAVTSGSEGSITAAEAVDSVLAFGPVLVGLALEWRRGKAEKKTRK